MVRAKKPKAKPVSELADELKQMVVDYVRQETVEPIQNLWKTFAFSIFGGAFLGGGFTMLLLGILRMFQTYIPAPPESWWSLVPYAATVLVAILIIAIVGFMLRGRSNATS